MDKTSEILKKVRKIEIKTRGLSKHIFAGEYHSAFKGRGMAFSEVRDYHVGDDIRNIDWNVTARFNSPFIKVFEEERELTVMILADVSGSKVFGTKTQLKQELITELAAVLSFSAIQNNDKVGLILFSDRIEKFVPPTKGRSHILRIIRELVDFEPVSKGTDVSHALGYFSNAIKKRCTAFILSDFIDDGAEQQNKAFVDSLTIANQKHDLIALKVYDQREAELPNIGLVKMLDAETGGFRWVDTSSRRIREQYSGWWQKNDSFIEQVCKRTGVSYTKIKTGEDYVKPLVKLFKQR